MKRNTNRPARTLDATELTAVRGGYDIAINHDLTKTLQNLLKPIDPISISAINNTK
jgi:hypothetical protein